MWARVVKTLAVWWNTLQQVANNIVFLCMTDAEAGSDRVRVPYAFLEDIKEEFSSTYGDRAQVFNPSP